jgi:hypothetical protein
MRLSFAKVAVAASTALLLASCAMPADDPNFNASAAAVDPADASAAAVSQEALAAALAAPTSIGVDAPLPAAPAKGASIVNLTTGSEYDTVFDTALDEAATTLGWTVENVTVSLTDPTTAVTAFDEALAKSPAGIHITGAFADSLVDGIAKATAAGVPVVCTGCSATGTTGVDASIDGTEQNTVWGQAMATYVVTSSQGLGQSATVQVIPTLGGAASDFNTSFNDSLMSQCRECGATVSDPMMIDMTDPSTITTSVVSELSTSMAGWALLDSGALSAGTADALLNDPTMLSPVVVVGRGAAAADVAALQALGGAAAPTASGSAAASASAAPSASAAASPEASAAASSDAVASGDAAAVDAATITPEQAAGLQAWIAIPQPVMAWRVIDQFARLIGGGEPATGPLPSQLLTGANAADAVLDANGNYIGIADYQDQFKALWGVK